MIWQQFDNFDLHFDNSFCELRITFLPREEIKVNIYNIFSLRIFL